MVFIKKQLIIIFELLIITFVILIISNYNYSFKKNIKYYLFEDNISFMKFKNIYDRYLGGIYFFNNNKKISPVFDSKISYINKELFFDGIRLYVSDNYLVPSLDEGIVTFIGYKELYGDTIIIQNKDNINIWYGNITNSSLKLYDHIDKGEYLGEVDGNYLYIVYSRGNRFLNCYKYFKN